MTELRQHMNRWVLIWAGIAFVLLVALGGVSIGLVAAISSSHTSTCVNNLLGDRAGVTAQDSSAHIDFAKELQQVLLAPKDQQPGEYAHFLTVLHNYVNTLVKDQQYRNAHPLGHC